MLLKRVFSQAYQLSKSTSLLGQHVGRAMLFTQSEDDHFSADGHLIDPYKTMEAYLPPKAFESVRQILYGPKCDEPSLGSSTLKRAD